MSSGHRWIPGEFGGESCANCCVERRIGIPDCPGKAETPLAHPDVDGQEQFDAEDAANLAKIAHVPDNHLRFELATINAEIEACHALLDAHFGLTEEGHTSLDILSDRLKRLLPTIGRGPVNHLADQVTTETLRQLLEAAQDAADFMMTAPKETGEYLTGATLQAAIDAASPSTAAGENKDFGRTGSH